MSVPRCRLIRIVSLFAAFSFSVSGEGQIITAAAQTDAVALHLTVVDQDSKPVLGLSKDVFKVFEDGIPQQIASFSENPQGVICGIAIDTSGSLRSDFSRATT